MTGPRGEIPDQRLQDVDQRAAALLSVQTYGTCAKRRECSSSMPAAAMMLARADVQQAIQKVGRVESYHLEAQLQ